MFLVAQTPTFPCSPQVDECELREEGLHAGARDVGLMAGTKEKIALSGEVGLSLVATSMMRMIWSNECDAG